MPDGSRRRPPSSSPAGRTITYGELDALSDRLRDRLAAWAWPRRSRRLLPAQVDRRRRHDLRHPEGRRRLRAGRPERARRAQRLHPAQLRGDGRRRRERASPSSCAPSSRRSARRRRCCVARRRRRRRAAARRARRARTRRRRAAGARRVAAGAGRPRLHPLHLGLDRQAQGRDAVARERARASSTGAPRCSSRRADDRFSSHAPFHFDLSILDIYVCAQARRDARADRRGPRQGPAAARAADRRRAASRSGTRRRRSSRCSRSTASCERHDYSRAARWCSSPARSSRSSTCARCTTLLPAAALLQSLRPDRDERLHLLRGAAAGSRASARRRIPIGKVCSHLRGARRRRARRDVPRGEEGELCIARPRRDAGLLEPARADRARRSSTDADGSRAGTGPATSSPRTPTATTPICGRRDRMVKRRGYRVELGEIEAGLYRHPTIKEAAVVALADEEAGVQHQRVPELPREQAPVADRAEALLRREPAALHDSRRVHVARRAAEDLDRQDRLPAPEGAGADGLPLTDEQKLLRDSIVQLRARRAQRTTSSSAIATRRSRASCGSKCAEIGLQGLPVPEEYGGSGARPARPARSRSRRSATAAATAASCSRSARTCSPASCRSGSTAARRRSERYLPGLCDGTLIGAHAMTEPDSGSDAFAMRTRAERDGDGWRLNGTKTFISNGPVADVVVVFAVTDPAKGYHGGVTRVPGRARHARASAPARSSRRWACAPRRSASSCSTTCCVPDDAVLGSVGGGADACSRTAMDWERTLPVRRARRHDGAAARDARSRYARTRTQFGQAIGKFQAVSHKIADMKVQLEAARLLVYRTASRLDRVAQRRRSTRRSPSSSSASRSSRPRSTRCRSTAATASWPSTRSSARCATRSAHDLLGHLARCSATSSRAGSGCRRTLVGGRRRDPAAPRPW